MGHIISIGGAAFTLWCTHGLVSPNFWATIPISNEYIAGIKIGAAVVTFLFLEVATSSNKS